MSGYFATWVPGIEKPEEGMGAAEGRVINNCDPPCLNPGNQTQFFWKSTLPCACGSNSQPPLRCHAYLSVMSVVMLLDGNGPLKP